MPTIRSSAVLILWIIPNTTVIFVDAAQAWILRICTVFTGGRCCSAHINCRPINVCTRVIANIVGTSPNIPIGVRLVELNSSAAYLESVVGNHLRKVSDHPKIYKYAIFKRRTSIIWRCSPAIQKELLGKSNFSSTCLLESSFSGNEFIISM